MEKHLPMELDKLDIENDTLLAWVYEWVQAGEENNSRNWIACFDKISRHFPQIREEFFQRYILNHFPIEAILTGLWSESSSNLSLFFANSIRNYDETFHIEFISRYPDLAYTLKRLPLIMETMPALNNMLILMS